MGHTLTIVAPPFAQVYWIFYGWATYGTLVSPYDIACFAWAGVLLAFMLIVSRE